MQYLLIVALFCLVPFVFCDSTFNPDRCKLIDQTAPGSLPSNTTNYLFRGDLPFDSDGNFAWDEMNSTFHQIVPSMSYDYVMIDLSLLNKFEPFEEETEKRYFKQNPDHGQYMNWPIWGNVLIVIKPTSLHLALFLIVFINF